MITSLRTNNAMENIVGSVGRACVGHCNWTGELNAEECGDRRCSGDRILDSIVLPRGTIFLAGECEHSTWQEGISKTKKNGGKVNSTN